MTDTLLAGGGEAPLDVPAAAGDSAPAEAPIAEITEPVVDASASSEAPADTAPEAAGESAIEAPAPEGAEATASEQPAESEAPTAPIYEDWTVPEGLEMKADQTETYNSILGKYGLSQEAGQELMEFGGGLIKQAQEQLAQQQHDIFNETRRNWVKAFEKQAGNQRNTILDDAKSAIRDAVPDDKARAELWDVLAFTGAGDHPAVINLLAALGKKTREGKAPAPSIATNVPANPADRRYGKSG